MRSINFKSLSVRNFLSIGEKPVEINFTPGVNIITGINHDKEDSKNGVGKSTIVDALHFALFGTTIRELTKDLIVNSVSKKNCIVELTFQITRGTNVNTYVVTRSLQPTKCFLSKDGVDITHSTLAKTNEYIQELLKSTSKVFQNSVIMTINSTVPFMAQSKVDKRKFIESVLNLEIFSGMLSLVRDEYNETKKLYEVSFAKKETIEKNYNLNQKQLESFEEYKNKQISDIDKKIAEQQTKITNLTNTIVTLPDNIDELISTREATIKNELVSIENEQKALFESITEYRTNIRHYENQKKEIEKVGSACTTCKRPYSDDDINHKKESLSSIDEEITKINNEYAPIKEQHDNKKTEYDNKNKELNEIVTKKDKVRDIKSNNNTANSKIIFINDSISEFTEQKAGIQQQSNTVLEESVKNLKNELDEQASYVSKYDKDLSVLECVKFVVSEEGVKSYIVKKILKILNTRLAFYLKELHTNCTCQFNEYFDEVIVDERNEEKSYFNFSGGERKRIDLACLFAFLDIRRMQGDVHFSTIFYDELLDTSLDDKGVELVLKVLRDRQTNFNENCYIITHRGTTVMEKIDNTIMLEKRNGFTSVA